MCWWLCAGWGAGRCCRGTVRVVSAVLSTVVVVAVAVVLLVVAGVALLSLFGARVRRGVQGSNPVSAVSSSRPPSSRPAALSQLERQVDVVQRGLSELHAVLPADGAERAAAPLRDWLADAEHNMFVALSLRASHEQSPASWAQLVSRLEAVSARAPDVEVLVAEAADRLELAQVRLEELRDVPHVLSSEVRRAAARSTEWSLRSPSVYSHELSDGLARARAALAARDGELALAELDEVAARAERVRLSLTDLSALASSTQGRVGGLVDQVSGLEVEVAEVAELYQQVSERFGSSWVESSPVAWQASVAQLVSQVASVDAALAARDPLAASVRADDVERRVGELSESLTAVRDAAGRVLDGQGSGPDAADAVVGRAVAAGMPAGSGGDEGFDVSEMLSGSAAALRKLAAAGARQRGGVPVVRVPPGSRNRPSVR